MLVNPKLIAPFYRTFSPSLLPGILIAFDFLGKIIPFNRLGCNYDRLIIHWFDLKQGDGIEYLCQILRE
jgi:hypothetical protein